MAKLKNLSFQKMTLNDVEAVNCIERTAHYHPWSKELLVEAVTSYQSWLLMENQHILGYGMLKIIADQAELLNIVISPNKQGLGLGKKLLEKLMLEVEQLGATECFLEVRESNTKAYKLYEQLGFNEVGRRANYYPAPKGREDALIMVYSIDKF